MRGLSVDRLLDDGTHLIPSDKWKTSDSADGLAILWLSDDPAPHNARAAVQVRETSSQNRLLDPGVFGPVLGLMGVLAGLGVNYMINKGAVSSETTQQTLKSIETRAAAAGCTNNQTEVAGVFACFDNYTVTTKNAASLQTQLKDQGKILAIMRGSYQQMEAQLLACRR